MALEAATSEPADNEVLSQRKILYTPAFRAPADIIRLMEKTIES